MRKRLHEFRSAPAKTKVLGLVTVAGFAVPALAYFAFVHHYALNVVLGDQWSDVVLVGKAFSGHLNLGDLWAQHNENRILVPNLIVLLLAYGTHLNIVTEEYLSAVLLAASVALIIWTHRRRSPATPLIWYCPVAILMFSWVQFGNTLWGFQIAWYVVLICLAGTLAVLDREQVNGPSLAIAAAIAVIGSFSSLQGLIIWPAGLILLLYRHRSWKVLAAWVIAAGATAGLYLYHLNSGPLGSYRINPFLHPVFEVKLFIFSLGNVAGKPLAISNLSVPQHNHPLLGTASPWIIAFGVVIFIAAVLAVARTGFRDTKERPEPLGVSLILFAFVFDASTAIGRGLYGYEAVSASKYTTYYLLALVGTYLVVISRPAPSPAQARVRRSSSVDPSLPATTSRALRQPLAVGFRALPVVVMACVLIAALAGYHNGASGGQHEHTLQANWTRTLRNYQSEGGQIVPSFGFAGALAPAALVRIAERDKLSLFDQH